MIKSTGALAMALFMGGLGLLQISVNLHQVLGFAGGAALMTIGVLIWIDRVEVTR